MNDASFDRFKMGDERVLSTYFKRHASPLLLFAYRLVADTSIAEEAVQDAYVKLWNGRNGIENEVHLTSFLYRVTRHACIDYLKGTSHRMRSASGELDENMMQTDNDLLARIIHAETLQLIYMEVKKLPPTQLQVFKLTFLEGLNTEEVCVQLEMTANAVFIAKSKALATLKRIFKDTDLTIFMVCCALLD